MGSFTFPFLMMMTMFLPSACVATASEQGKQAGAKAGMHGGQAGRQAGGQAEEPPPLPLSAHGSTLRRGEPAGGQTSGQAEAAAAAAQRHCPGRTPAV